MFALRLDVNSGMYVSHKCVAYIHVLITVCVQVNLYALDVERETDWDGRFVV